MDMKRALEYVEVKHRMVMAERDEYDWSYEIERKEVTFYVKSNIKLISACGFDQDFYEIY